MKVIAMKQNEDESIDEKNPYFDISTDKEYKDSKTVYESKIKPVLDQVKLRSRETSGRISNLDLGGFAADSHKGKHPCSLFSC